jgi:ferredoxin
LGTSGFDGDGEDYYAILGVDPAADSKTIRKAYHATMRDCHPDLSNGEEALEFSTFLNEIYETLMDPETRVDYDSLIGFSKMAKNPFRDTTFERDQVFVDEISCIGCTNCVGVCPKTFAMMNDEHGRARVLRQDVDSVEHLQEAIDTCPVNCISWVTAPQLTLLETVMRKMDRVSVDIMNNGGGHCVNVFTEASIAWEKRQALIRERENAERLRSIWEMWTPAGGAATGTTTAGESGPSKQRRKSSQTAANAAKAARRWRDYQRRKHNKEELQLPSGL